MLIKNRQCMYCRKKRRFKFYVDEVQKEHIYNKMKEEYSTLNEDGAKKYDGEKLRYDLLPMECLEEIVKVYTFGAVKYGENNWQGLSNFEDRYYGALLRHLAAWRKGEKIDGESGLFHIAQVAWNAFALLWHDLRSYKNGGLDVKGERRMEGLR